MNIQRYSEYNSQYEMADEFLKSFDKMIKESDGSSSFQKVAKKVIFDLKLNISLVATFGAGIGALYPVVQGLMENMNMDSFNLNTESVVLLTLAAVSIVYLEEKKCKTPEEEAELTKDSKSILEELKMRGFGNGIVKKLIQGLKSIKNIFSIIGKHVGAVIGGVIDMFAYTSLLIPLLNGVMAVIHRYNLNLETLPQNFLGLAVGIGTIIAKHGIVEIINRLKDKFTINQKEILDEIETPVIQKFATFGDGDNKQSGDLIKEQ